MQETAQTSVEATEEIASIWRRTAARGDSCIVRNTRHNTKQRGRVRRTAKAGCDVEFEDKHTAFIYWRDLYPDVEAEAARSSRKTFGKLGDVANFPQLLPSVAKEPTALEPIPPPPPANQAEVPAPSSSVSLSPKRNRHRPESTYKRVAHAPTAIGNLFRSERLKNKLDQEELAELLGVKYWRISDIELGDLLPDMDLLKSFGECFNIPLALLSSILEGKQATGTDPLLAINRINELEAQLSAQQNRHEKDLNNLARDHLSEKTRLTNAVTDAGSALVRAKSVHVEELSSLKAQHAAELRTLREKLDVANRATIQASSNAHSTSFSQFMEILEFTNKLAAINPLPKDEAKRRSWYEVAYETHSKMRKI